MDTDDVILDSDDSLDQMDKADQEMYAPCAASYQPTLEEDQNLPRYFDLQLSDPSL